MSKPPNAPMGEKPAADVLVTHPPKRDWKTFVILGLVFVALVGSLSAWLVGKASRQPAIDELTAERDALQEDKANLETQAAELQGRIDELNARRDVSRSVEELVARNFGSAQEALESAAAGLRARGHAELADRVSAVVLEPTADVGEQRDALLTLARDVDRAIGD